MTSAVLPPDADTSDAAAELFDAAAELFDIGPDRTVRLNLNPGQEAAWDATERIVAVLAGTGAGKTSFGPWWLAREIANRGTGDYLAVTSTYDLFLSKMLPTLQEVFEHTLRIGRYWPSTRVIEIAEPTERRFLARRATDPMWARIMLRSADTGGGLEAATGKGAWLDEAGQDKFRLESWRAVRRRMASFRGRVLITTTLYNFGWLKTEVYDRWKAGDPRIKVVSFPSIANPKYPREEWDDALATLPEWYFNMQYRGRFERPAGFIYDCFLDAPRPEGHLCPRFAVPVTWPRLLGLDFGGTHTAGVFFALDPSTRLLYGYREYMGGNRTARQHVEALREGEPAEITAVGGSWSEGQWRDEFQAAGLEVRRPDVSEVDIGIRRVYGAFRQNKVILFDDLNGSSTEAIRGLLGELRSYARKVDAAGLPTDEIDNKSRYHKLDAVRYILGWYFSPTRNSGKATVAANPVAGYRGRR